MPSPFLYMLTEFCVLTLAECPVGQIFSECSGSCPHICEDLWPHTQCIEGPCVPGCTCPDRRVRMWTFFMKETFLNFCFFCYLTISSLLPQVLYDGSCVPHVECPCSPLSLPADYRNNSMEEMTGALFPPGTTVQHLCNTW